MSGLPLLGKFHRPTPKLRLQVSHRPTPTPSPLLPSQPGPVGPLTVLYQKSKSQPLTGGQLASPVRAGTLLPWGGGGGVVRSPVLVYLPANRCPSCSGLPEAQADSLF